ncbi:MAG: phosphatidylserine decarboxylase [Gammaproteobacteria bacterium]
MIAREGWLALAFVAVLATLVLNYIGFIASLPFWILCGLLLFVFRDPPRSIPPNPLAVVSPVDGKVVSIEETHDPYLDRQAVLISIQMNPYGVFSTRSPVEGKMLEPHNEPFNRHGSNGEAPHGVWLQTDEEDDLVMVVNRGPFHNAPKCYADFGERVGQGQRCGFVHFGSRVDVYLPVNSRIEIGQQDHVKGGTDVIASLVHK